MDYAHFSEKIGGGGGGYSPQPPLLLIPVKAVLFLHYLCFLSAINMQNDLLKDCLLFVWQQIEYGHVYCRL